MSIYKIRNEADIEFTVEMFKPGEGAFSIQKLHIFEELGGNLPRGEIFALLDGKDNSANSAKDVYTGTITITKAEFPIYSFSFFITSRKIFNTDFRFKFIIAPTREFFTNLHTMKWEDSIDNVIKALFPGSTEFRNNVSTDLSNGLEFFQQRQTDHEFCSFLCSSFKHDIVFGFGFDGLLIKETIDKDHDYKQEPYYVVWGNQEVSQITDFKFPYNRDLYLESINPWEEYENESENENLPDNTEYESKNCCCMRTNGEYRIMGRDYYQLLQNRRYNLRYLDSNIFTGINILTTNLAKWKLGDVIYYSRRWREGEPSLPYNVFLVKSNEIYYAADTTEYMDANGFKFSWTTHLVGLKQSDEFLNKADPSEEE